MLSSNHLIRGVHWLKSRKIKMIAAGSALMTSLAGLSAMSASAATTVPPLATIAQITQGAPMNMFNPNGLKWGALDEMPLAFPKNTADMSAFFPGLAKSWKITNNGRTVTVFLRPGAKWSNGQPITATDLVTTAACEFAAGWIWWDLGSVKAINQYEVQYTMAPGAKFNIFPFGVLTQTIVPTSQYAPLLPKNVWTLIKQSQYAGTDKAQLALQTKAQADLTLLGKKISAFAPKTDVSSGPFVISGVNPGEAVLVKNPDFYGAANIHVNEVVLRNYTSNQGIWNYMIGGQVNQATSSMPTSIKQRAAQTPGNVYYQVPSYYANSLMFNEHVYPYNVLKVRQALAYMINRNTVQAIGEPVSGSPVKYIDGMTNQQTSDTLTPAEQAQLTLYRYNPAKAAKLLESAGFKKVNGQWELPNGKPWTASLYVNSSYTDWVQGASVVANQMTQFGIKTSPVLIQPAQFATEQSQGKFALSFWTIALGPDVYWAFGRLYGGLDGYNMIGGKLSYTSSVSKGNWVNFPQTVAIPTYGSVQPGPLTNNLAEAMSPTVLHSDTAKLALVSNRYLPAITLWSGMQAGFVNTTNYTDFPLHSSPVMLAGVGFYPPVGFWMLQGYIRPKS